MPAPTGLVTTGASITFGTSAYLSAILNCSLKGFKRKMIDTSNFGSATWMTYIVGALSDPGAIDFETLWDPDKQLPINSAAETVTLTFKIPAGKSTAANVSGSAAVEGWEVDGKVEDKWIAKGTVKFLGALTWVASS